MRPRVLVVDDDPGMRAILREFLAREEFEVAEEPSVSELIVQLKRPTARRDTRAARAPERDSGTDG